MALVTTTANGDKDRARPSRERVRETRGREGRSAGRCRASPWRSDGDEEAAGGGSRRWPREHAPATRLCLLAEVGDDWHRPGGRASTGKAQVGFSLSLFF